MPESEARRRATARYRKAAGVRQFCLKFFPKDLDLYDWVKSKPMSTAYILSLIREDMERSKGQQ